MLRSPIRTRQREGSQDKEKGTKEKERGEEEEKRQADKMNIMTDESDIDGGLEMIQVEELNEEQNQGKVRNQSDKHKGDSVSPTGKVEKAGGNRTEKRGERTLPTEEEINKLLRESRDNVERRNEEEEKIRIVIRNMTSPREKAKRRSSH